MELQPQARVMINPLDIQRMQRDDKYKIALENLEGQLLHYIITSANQGTTISTSFISELFKQSKEITTPRHTIVKTY